ncbi:hypothetical protein GWK47_020213 [Chionoecetes opilio]|uniref:Uncharacterized protein n=1 Tax=Chionoecetes opilio TaxID=41210 RepID=A0A8J5CIG1_CHIOP|nr:hypothetical protein GWK47_020213 [Chionoecetes opilio]
MLIEFSLVAFHRDAGEKLIDEAQGRMQQSLGVRGASRVHRVTPHTCPPSAAASTHTLVPCLYRPLTQVSLPTVRKENEDIMRELQAASAGINHINTTTVPPTQPASSPNLAPTNVPHPSSSPPHPAHTPRPTTSPDPTHS